jgi:hypothetical protein
MNSPPLSAAESAKLAGLHDIIEPPAIGLWPPAPGWFLVAALVLLLGLRMVQALWRHWRRNRYRRTALRSLRALEARLDAQTPQQNLNDALLILHACALAMPGTPFLAGPDDAKDREAWLAFLRARLPAMDHAMPTRLLGEAAYWPAHRIGADDARAVLNFVAYWIRHHRQAA